METALGAVLLEPLGMTVQRRAAVAVGSLAVKAVGA